jgi:hypothetical protein
MIQLTGDPGRPGRPDASYRAGNLSP